MSNKPTAKKQTAKKTTAAKKQTTAKKAVATKKAAAAAELTLPTVRFDEDGTVVIDNRPTKRGPQSAYDKAQQDIIDTLTKRVTDVQKRLNGVTLDLEGATQGFARAQRWHAEKEANSSRITTDLHRQLAQRTSTGADCSFIVEATQMLGEAFDVKLVASDTGHSPFATWQIGELQIDFVGGRNRSFKAISTENAEVQIVQQDIPLGRGFGELTATSISFIRDLLRAITHEGKKELSSQSAYASWFPSPLPQRSKGESLRHLQEEALKSVQQDDRLIRCYIGETAMYGAESNVAKLMETLDQQSHHRSSSRTPEHGFGGGLIYPGDQSASSEQSINPPTIQFETEPVVSNAPFCADGRQAHTTPQDGAAKVDDLSHGRGRLKNFETTDTSSSGDKIDAMLNVMTSSKASTSEILRIMYALAELMPDNGAQPDKSKIDAVRHTLENTTDRQLASVLIAAIWGMLNRVNPDKSSPRG